MHNGVEQGFCSLGKLLLLLGAERGGLICFFRNAYDPLLCRPVVRIYPPTPPISRYFTPLLPCESAGRKADLSRVHGLLCNQR